MTRLVVLGAINWDISLFVERFAKIGEEIPVKRISRVPGGKAANVAVAASRILGSGEVSIIGGLGKDKIGVNQIKILNKEGIDSSGIKQVDSESGQAYITIDREGRNTIQTLYGANLEISPEDLLDPRRYPLIRKAPIIVIMDPPFTAALKMAEIGREKGKPVLWDPGAKCAAGADHLKNIFKNINYLLVNRVEAENLTGTNDLKKASEYLLKINKEMKVVIKLGAEGCVMTNYRRTVSMPGVPLENMEMKAVNTVGCGDAFLGVFSASLTKGLEDVEALKRANLAGAFKATRYETRGSPTLKELEEFERKVSLLKL